MMRPLITRFFDTLIRFAFVRLFFLYMCLYAAPLRVGVIVPAQHPAMNAIVEGLKETLTASDVELTIKNAQGDARIQQQIIHHMVAQKMDALMPIGTTTSLMTLALAPHTPVVALAASFEMHPDIKQAKRSLTVINDEITVHHVLNVITHHMPQAKHIGILYSNSEKNLPDVERANSFCRKHSLSLHLRKIDTCQEVLQYAPTLAKQVEVLVVMKDHMVVSAISAVIAATSQASCLLVVMDDGSVRQGAPLGIGIVEKDIGRAAGKALRHRLTRRFPQNVEEISLRSPHIFINPEAFARQKHINLHDLTAFCKVKGMPLDRLPMPKEKDQ